MITFLELGNYGRLGNQMWQIASTIGIAMRNSMSYAFPEWDYTKVFGNKLPEKTWKQLNKIDWITIAEPSPYYNSIPFEGLDFHTNINLNGYFQSHKYFDHCSELIKETFDFGYRATINGVSIHVRRGDYKGLKHIHTNYDETDYYEKAMKLFPTSEFIVFSDDVPWCRDHFGTDHVDYFDSDDDFESMKYMSCCSHHIIANSSFSWWAAYLGNNPDRTVVAPKKWVENETHNDRLLTNWITI